MHDLHRLTHADHSIEAGEECVMVYINNTLDKQANARFVNCETDRGRVIRAFSTRIIRREEEIIACYQYVICAYSGFTL